MVRIYQRHLHAVYQRGRVKGDGHDQIRVHAQYVGDQRPRDGAAVDLASAPIVRQAGIVVCGGKSQAQ